MKQPTQQQPIQLRGLGTVLADGLGNNFSLNNNNNQNSHSLGLYSQNAQNYQKMQDEKESVVVSETSYSNAIVLTRQRATSPARVWIFLYAFLTWMMSITMFGVIVHVYKTASISPGIIQNMGCYKRTQHSNWSHAISTYQLVEKVKNNTFFEFASGVGEEAIKGFNCSGGGLLNAGRGSLEGSARLMSGMFEYTTAQCSCVLKMNQLVYIPGMQLRVAEWNAKNTSNTSRMEQAIAFTNAFLFSGNQNATANQTYINGYHFSTPPYSIRNHPSLMQECLFGRRPTQTLERVDDCFTSVIPFTVIMYINAVAGAFASIYVHSLYSGAEGGAESKSLLLKEGKTFSDMAVKIMSHEASTVLFLVLNVALGLTGLIIPAVDANPSAGYSYIAGILGFLAVLGLVLLMRVNVSTINIKSMGAMLRSGGSAVYEKSRAAAHKFRNRGNNKNNTVDLFLGNNSDEYKAVMTNSSPPASAPEFVSAEEELHSKDRIMQYRSESFRLLFWGHYVLVIPAFVLLMDHMQQSRFAVFTSSRVMYSVALAGMGLFTDLSYLVYEYVQDNLNAKPTAFNTAATGLQEELLKRNFESMNDQDGARSTSWWAWGCWCVLAALFFQTERPVQLSAGITYNLFPMSGIALGVLVLVLGVPLLAKTPSVHVENSKAYEWQGDKSTLSLGLCLAIEFVARTLVTLTVVYWTIW